VLFFISSPLGKKREEGGKKGSCIGDGVMFLSLGKEEGRRGPWAYIPLTFFSH